MANDTFDFSEVVDSFEMTEQEDSTTPIEEAPDAFPAFNEEPEALNIFEKIAKGDKGDPGKSFTISGILENVGQLPEDVPIGTCYLVGLTSPYDGYVLTDGGWENIGPILHGPKGDPGREGDPGQKGDPGEDYILTESDKVEIATIAANMARAALLNEVYPIGSIYISTNATSPATLFGGTWEQIEDMFLLAAGQTYAAGTQGGHANAIVPYHTHTTEKGGAFTFTVRAIGRASGAYQVTANSGVTDAVSGASQRYVSSNDGTTTGTNVQDRIVHSGHNHTVNYAGTSGNATGANMPPYVAVYVWKRVQDTVEEGNE